MSRPPSWATRILATVCEEEGIEEPTIVWRRSKGYYSSGRADKDRLLVTAGTFSQNRRLIFYHEMAHVVGHAKYGEKGHPPEHFARTFGYVKRFGYCTMREAKRSEFSYRVAAKAGYRQYRKEKGS